MASAAAYPPSRTCVPCPSSISIQGVAPGSPVSFDKDRNSFVVHLDKLTSAHLQMGKLTVRVKNELSSWVDLTLDITGFDIDLKRRFASRASEMARVSDPSEELRKFLGDKYQTVFGRFVEDFRAMKALLAVSSSSDQIPKAVRHPFAQFYSEAVIAKDFTIHQGHAAGGGERKEGVPDLAVNKSIKVHKFVLVASSEVFKRMFQEGRISNGIEIEDSSYEAIEKFVMYLYTKSIVFAHDKEAWEVYQLADRFQVDCLKAVSKAGYCKEVMRLFDPGTILRPKDFELSLKRSNADQMVPLYERTAAKISAFYKVGLDHMLA